MLLREHFRIKPGKDVCEDKYLIIIIFHDSDEHLEYALIANDEYKT